MANSPAGSPRCEIMNCITSVWLIFGRRVYWGWAEDIASGLGDARSYYYTARIGSPPCPIWRMSSSFETNQKSAQDIVVKAILAQTLCGYQAGDARVGS